MFCHSNCYPPISLAKCVVATGRAVIIRAYGCRSGHGKGNAEKGCRIPSGKLNPETLMTYPKQSIISTHVFYRIARAWLGKILISLHRAGRSIETLNPHLSTSPETAACFRRADWARLLAAYFSSASANNPSSPPRAHVRGPVPGVGFWYADHAFATPTCTALRTPVFLSPLLSAAS